MKKILERRRVEEGLQHLVLQIFNYLVVITALLIALSFIGIDFTALIAVAGIAGLALGFGLQTIVSNFVSGLIIMFERSIQVGDLVEVGDRFGRVSEIEARVTTVRTMDNVSVMVPNENLISKEVINWTKDDSLVRLKIPLGVAYGTDVEKVRKILMETAKENEDVLETPPPNVFFEEFGNSSLNFSLMVWIDQPSYRKRVKSKINFEIDRRCREEGIEIPFPQRDVWLRGGNSS